jgi:chromosome segregation protein
MHLDKLELLGFKSFPEKTVLKFSPGISCIVGPNGCGKTNILDALRWVLGETRMSILRGGKLEEVIFSGTREIKPLGMAEVNLSILNDRGVLTTPYNQITITRRLYRSGDSEFLINRVPCRLKDITEMFYDTGLTSGTYSVIEQDMIDIILSDKAEDRRHFFEEASGITKYKQRKKEALRKLESTEADLLRLEDVYSEVSSQAGSLKRQVAKAERHKKLNDEIEKIGVELAIDRWLKIEEMSSELAAKGKQFQSDLEAVKSNIHIHELDREKIKIDIAEKENAIRSKRENLSKLTDRLHNLEKLISVLQEKSENTKNRHYLTVGEIETLEGKSDNLSDEIEKAQKDSEEFRNEIEALETEVSEGEDKLSEMTRAAQELSRQYEDTQNQIKVLNRELSESQESQITLDLKYSSSLEKIEEIKADIHMAESELDALNIEKNNLLTTKSDLESRIHELNSTRANLAESLEQLHSTQQDLRSEHEKLSAEYHQLNAAIELAGKVIHQYEGYTSGAAQIGSVKEYFPGMIDTVANLINPQPEYVACVQTVLGELSNYFVVDNQETAQKVLAYGREHKLGRFGLIILDNIPEPADPEVSFPTNPNIIGQLSNFISADEKYSRLIKYLFKDVLVATNLFEEKGLEGFDMVSPAGEMLDFQKSLAIGGTEEILLVGQKARFDELNEKRGEIEARNGEISQQLENISIKLEETESQISETVDKLTGLKEELASLNTSIAQADLKSNALSAQLSERRKSRADIEEKLQEIDSEKSGLGELLTSKRGRLSEMESHASELKEQHAKATAEKEEYSRELSNLKMKLFSMESSLKTTENNLRRLGELKTEIENSSEEKNRLLGELTLDMTRLSREIKDREAEIKNVYEDRENSSKILMEAEGEITEISTKLNAIDKTLKEKRNRHEELSDEVHNIDIKINSISSQKETLAVETLEKYNCDLNAQSRVIKYDDDERSAKEEELAQLKSKIESMGPVNLLALEEYDQTKSRADFLKNQIDDLNKAKEDLRTTITRINTTARKKFLDTFEIVKKNFQNVFCELFEGGEANLTLEENADPLEAPIHISARPRGKRLLSIHQLSGGERALTATALLFSFYMVKPSPFCILDEVDAPLDDANIARFLKLIKRFTDNTQFIIITHNKLTMEQAETLYGITMSRPGISQIVSVDLKSRGEGMDSSDDILFAEDSAAEQEESPESESDDTSAQTGDDDSTPTETKNEVEEEVEVQK